MFMLSGFVKFVGYIRSFYYWEVLPDRQVLVTLRLNKISTSGCPGDNLNKEAILEYPISDLRVAAR